VRNVTERTPNSLVIALAGGVAVGYYGLDFFARPVERTLLKRTGIHFAPQPGSSASAQARNVWKGRIWYAFLYFSLTEHAENATIHADTCRSRNLESRMTQHERILVVDDEVNIRRTLSALLQRAGYEVTSAEHGREAIGLLGQRVFDLMLVDLKMPEIGGMEVVAAARERQPEIAIIVLTGHGSLESAIDGLHHNVFDYILKTSEPSYVIERVKAGLAAQTQQRRQKQLLDVVGEAVDALRQRPTQSSESSAGAPQTVVAGALRLDPWRQEATLEGRTLALTPTEFRVLLCLAERAGTMLSYTELVQCAQGYAPSEQEAGELIKPHIHHLRQKLEPDPGAPRYLLNVRGKGYLFSPVGD
jgi:DNA-binding response OmpR family regulator